MARAVIGDIAAAIGRAKLDAVGRERRLGEQHIPSGAAPRCDGHDRRVMLEQEEIPAPGRLPRSDPFIDHPRLQLALEHERGVVVHPAQVADLKLRRLHRLSDRIAPPASVRFRPMARVHPTAIVEGDVTLASDVDIGPYCIVRGPVTLGPGCVLISHVNLQGPLTMGERNVLYPHVCLGFAPQHAAYDPAKPGAGLTIGSNNTFREYVSIHRAFTEHATRIGDRNLFMNGSHAGHDSVIGNDCTFAGGAMLAGHVEIADRVIIGGAAAVHQFVRIARGAMISGLTGATKDVLPFNTITALNVAGSINLVGMRRLGLTPEQIDSVKWAWSVLCRRGLPMPKALAALEERAAEPIVAEILAFAKGSKRGWCTLRSNELR